MATPGASAGVCLLVLGHQNSQLPGVPPLLTPGSPHALPSLRFTVVDGMFLAARDPWTSQTKVLKQLLMLQSLE